MTTDNWFKINTCLHPDYRKICPGKWICTTCGYTSKIGYSMDPVDEQTWEWKRLATGFTIRDYIPERR